MWRAEDGASRASCYSADYRYIYHNSKYGGHRAVLYYCIPYSLAGETRPPFTPGGLQLNWFGLVPTRPHSQRCPF